MSQYGVAWSIQIICFFLSEHNCSDIWLMYQNKCYLFDAVNQTSCQAEISGAEIGTNKTVKGLKIHDSQFFGHAYSICPYDLSWPQLTLNDLIFEIAIKFAFEWYT